jgi:DNA-binding GntR family transcriptional regulator
MAAKKPAKVGSDDAQPVRGSGVKRVYATLRQEIIEMILLPGEHLDETRLSERFQMSRTPVREALVLLAAEGHVTTLPNRNTVVSSIDFERLPVYFDALTLMYRVTTRLAAMKRRDADIAVIEGHSERFNAAVDNADALAMIGANRDLHVAIAEAGGNPYYTDFFGRLLDSGRRILRIYYRTFDDHLPRHYADEHAAIIASIAARDADRPPDPGVSRLGPRRATRARPSGAVGLSGLTVRRGNGVGQITGLRRRHWTRGGNAGRVAANGGATTRDGIRQSTGDNRWGYEGARTRSVACPSICLIDKAIDFWRSGRQSAGTFRGDLLE